LTVLLRRLTNNTGVLNAPRWDSGVVTGLRAKGSTINFGNYVDIAGVTQISEYTALAKNWVEVAKRVAAGAWDGIVCPKNADADVLIEVREQRTGTDDARFEYWIHCPRCGAEIYFHSKDRYSPAPNAAGSLG
jgi:hypothetical protein